MFVENQKAMSRLNNPRLVNRALVNQQYLPDHVTPQKFHTAIVVRESTSPDDALDALSSQKMQREL